MRDLRERLQHRLGAAPEDYRWLLCVDGFHKKIGDVTLVSGRSVVGGNLYLDPRLPKILDAAEVIDGTNSPCESDTFRPVDNAAVSVAPLLHEFTDDGKKGSLSDAPSDDHQPVGPFQHREGVP